jgi:signal peptidase I
MQQAEKRNGLLFHFCDVVLNIVLIVGIVVGIRTFLVSPFQVEGNSMLSTLEDKEYIIINKLAYYIGDPKRGDIVVFFPPHEEKSRYYVKRIIGLPGDEVVLKEGYVFLREKGSQALKRLPEDYLDAHTIGKTFSQPHGSDGNRPVSYTIPESHFFVLGDNRQGSLDSRSFMSQRNKPLPFVPMKNIRGRVWFVVLPITKMHAFASPEYAL